MRVAELVEGLRLLQQKPPERGRLAIAKWRGIVHTKAVDVRKVQRQQTQRCAHAEEWFRNDKGCACRFSILYNKYGSSRIAEPKSWLGRV